MPPERLIPDKIANGHLPTQHPHKVWVGNGNGHRCDGCDETIAATDLEHELDFAGGVTLRFHVQCAAIWRRATGRD